MLYFKDFIYLFIHETQRERQRHRQREKQGPCNEPKAGLDPGTPGSGIEPKADAQPLSPSDILKIGDPNEGLARLQGKSGRVCLGEAPRRGALTEVSGPRPGLKLIRQGRQQDSTSKGTGTEQWKQQRGFGDLPGRVRRWPMTRATLGKSHLERR